MKTLTVGPDAVHSEGEEQAQYDGLDGLRHAIESSCRASETRAIRIRLSPKLAQLRRLQDLPPVPSRELVALVSHQRDRFFRTTHDALVGAVKEPGEDVVLAGAVDRAVVEAIEEGVDASGHRLEEISIDEPAWARLEFLTAGIAARRRRRTLSAWLLAASLGLSGWLAAGAAYALDLRGDARLVEQQLSDLQEPLERLRSLEARLSEFSIVAGAVSRQLPDQESMVLRMTELASALPQSVHLTRLELQRDGPSVLELHGVDAVETMVSLDAFPFGTARLLSPPDSVPGEPGRVVFTAVLEPGS